MSCCSLFVHSACSPDGALQHFCAFCTLVVPSDGAVLFFYPWDFPTMDVAGMSFEGVCRFTTLVFVDC